MPFVQNTRRSQSGAAQVSQKRSAHFLTTAFAAAMILGAISIGASGQEQAPVPSQEWRVPIDANSAAQIVRGQHHSLPAAERPEAGATLDGPYGLAVDNSGNVYAANLYSNKVTVYNKSFKLAGTIETGLNMPAAVGVAFGGNVYVLNEGASNITVYNSSLAQTGTITDSSLLEPFSMYIDAFNDIWVLDDVGTVHLYLQDGTPINSYPAGAGSAIGPHGSEATLWGIPAGGGNYITYVGNMGGAVHSDPSIFTKGIGPTSWAGGVAQDAFGQQYVSNSLTNQVELEDAAFTSLNPIFSTPSAPFGIAVDTINQRIFVSETEVSQILVYSLKSPYKHIATIK